MPTSFPHLRYIGHELVAERDRRRCGQLPEDRRLVRVAKRNGDRAHERLPPVLDHRLWHLLPLDLLGLQEGQLPHAPSVPGMGSLTP